MMRTPRRVPQIYTVPVEPQIFPPDLPSCQVPSSPRLGNLLVPWPKSFSGISPRSHRQKPSACLGSHHAAGLAILARPERPRNPALGDESGTRHFSFIPPLPPEGWASGIGNGHRKEACSGQSTAAWVIWRGHIVHIDAIEGCRAYGTCIISLSSSCTLIKAL